MVLARRKRTYKPRRAGLARTGRGLKQGDIVPRHYRNMGLSAAGAAAAQVASRYVTRDVAKAAYNVAKSIPRRKPSTVRPTPRGSLISQHGEYGDALRKTVVLSRVSPIPARTLKLGFNKRILRWQMVNIMNSGAATCPGKLQLDHCTSGTDNTLAPMYLFCLSQTNNQSALTTGPCSQVRFNNSGGLNLLNRNCQDPDGSQSGAKWVQEAAFPQPNIGTTVATRYIMQAWYDIKLLCYGATSQPTKYTIEVISFNDGYLDPYESPSSTQEVDDRHALYQSMVQPLMSNPIMTFTRTTKKYKVHASASFTIQPSLTIEADTTPASRIVRLFLKDGRLQDYMYHGDGFKAAGADDLLSTTQYTRQGTAVAADYSEVPRARARLWLVIKAMNTTRTATTTESTPANTPSFDIVVRKGEYLQAR